VAESLLLTFNFLGVT